VSTQITVLIALVLILGAALAWRALGLHEREKPRLDEIEANNAARELEDSTRKADEAAARAEPAIHRRVTASLLNNEGGIEGLVTEYLEHDLRFEDAKFLAPGQAPDPVDGSVLIPRDRILLLQVHPG
jgi:hypothetical protein